MTWMVIRHEGKHAKLVNIDTLPSPTETKPQDQWIAWAIRLVTAHSLIVSPSRKMLSGALYFSMSFADFNFAEPRDWDLTTHHQIVPDELRAWAAENDIEVLTHENPRLEPKDRPFALVPKDENQRFLMKMRWA